MCSAEIRASRTKSTFGYLFRIFLAGAASYMNSRGIDTHRISYLTFEPSMPSKAKRIFLVTKSLFLYTWDKKTTYLQYCQEDFGISMELPGYILKPWPRVPLRSYPAQIPSYYWCQYKPSAWTFIVDYKDLVPDISMDIYC